MNNYQQSLSRISSFNTSKGGFRGVNISNTDYVDGYFGVGELISNSVTETEEYIARVSANNSIREEGSIIAERLKAFIGSTAEKRAKAVFAEYYKNKADKKTGMLIIQSACEELPELNVRCFTVIHMEIQALSKNGRVLYSI